VLPEEFHCRPGAIECPALLRPDVMAEPTRLSCSDESRRFAMSELSPGLSAVGNTLLGGKVGSNEHFSGETVGLGGLQSREENRVRKFPITRDGGRAVISSVPSD
jgi:hypothetical protein